VTGLNQIGQDDGHVLLMAVEIPVRRREREGGEWGVR
jgi:hypothetical protein